MSEPPSRRKAEAQAKPSKKGRGGRGKRRARVRGSRAEGEHRQHLKLMSKQSEGLIEGQRKTQRNDALHEDPCVGLVCRKVCKKKDM